MIMLRDITSTVSTVLVLLHNLVTSSALSLLCHDKSEK